MNLSFAFTHVDFIGGRHEFKTCSCCFLDQVA